MKRSISTLFTVVALSACSGSGTSSDTTDTDPAVTDTETTGQGSTGTSGDPTSGGETTDPSAETTADPTEGTTGGETDTAAETTSGDPTEGTTGTTGGSEDVTIVGEWLSEGKNVAPLLVQLTGAASITATFEDMTFEVLTVDTDGQEVSQAGVYVVETTDFGNIMEITLEQSMPQTITAEGIFEIDNSTNPPTMRYEVVQTVPSVGAEVPTAEGGFGATNLGSDLTQVFVWQE